jgi:hypothetical protein
MEQPESLKLVSFVLDDDDDDEYTPSTPTRGNHSIYPTLALQGKAISPVSPTFLVRPTLFRCLTYLITYPSPLFDSVNVHGSSD